MCARRAHAAAAAAAARRIRANPDWPASRRDSDRAALSSAVRRTDAWLARTFANPSASWWHGSARGERLAERPAIGEGGCQAEREKAMARGGWVGSYEAAQGGPNEELVHAAATPAGRH